MDLTSLLVFTGALFVAAASPGPGIAAIVARVLGRGMNGAIAFTAGVALGDVVWLTFAVLGLAVVAQTFQAVFPPSSMPVPPTCSIWPGSCGPPPSSPTTLRLTPRT